MRKTIAIVLSSTTRFVIDQRSGKRRSPVTMLFL